LPVWNRAHFSGWQLTYIKAAHVFLCLDGYGLTEGYCHDHSDRIGVFALLATIAALVTGIVSMAHGGGFDQRHSHQIMFARLGFRA